MVAAQLEKNWEQSLLELHATEQELNELRDQVSTKLTQAQRDLILQCSRDVHSLWNDSLSVVDHKEIVRLLLQQVTVTVQNNTQRVDVRLQWRGGYESVYEITRTVTLYPQMDNYRELMQRMLQLVLEGRRTPEVAAILEQEGYRSPRHTKPISASMIGKLLADDPACHRQLTEPEPLDDQWLGRDLASAIGVAEKKLKDWVTRGWMIADQRPFGRVWLFWADANELERLRQLSAGQRGQGRPSPPESLRTPQRKVRETSL